MKYFALLLLNILSACNSKTKDTVVLSKDQLTEVSGIAASRLNDGVFYVHNDSGDSSRFFAVNENAGVMATFIYKGDSTVAGGVRDVEDMAVGVGPIASKNYVYLGDIGDNNAVRQYITVYRFEEPTSTSGNNFINGVKFFLQYTNGAKDAETMMIDNKDRLIYIITKREASVEIHTASIDAPVNSITKLQFRTKITLPGSGQTNWLVAGDISEDGNKILLKTYEKVFYWERNGGERIWETLQKSPKELPYTIDGLGEAICFNKNATAYYTVPEGINPVITKYALK